MGLNLFIWKKLKVISNERSNEIQNLFLKLKLAFSILFGKRSYVILSVKKNEVISLLRGDDLDIDAAYINCKKYISMEMIKQASDELERADLILEKSLFFARYEEFKTTKTK